MAILPSASTTIDESAAHTCRRNGLCRCHGLRRQRAPIQCRASSRRRRRFSISTDIIKGSRTLLRTSAKTRKPTHLLLVCPSPRQARSGSLDQSGVTGSSAITVVADSLGVLEEVDASLTFPVGGTIGTDQLYFDLSLDGGFTVNRVRLGNANTYTIPNVGLVIDFGAGTVAAGDTVTFRSKAPAWNGAGITAARVALAGQQNLAAVVDCHRRHGQQHPRRQRARRGE